jgi:3-dehydroquinate dehydratase-2
VSIPTVEVHISKVSEREAFRQVSFVSYYAARTIQGMGFEGYGEAIRWLKRYIEDNSR